MFEGFIKNSRNDRYNIMCAIDAHEVINPSEHDDEINNSGYPLP